MKRTRVEQARELTPRMQGGPFSWFPVRSAMLRLALSAALCCVSEAALVALVTGANKGIGREIARKLASVGITAIIGCRNLELGRAAAEELASAGDVFVQRLDLTDSSSIEATRAFVEETFGKLDILVNNAAVCFNDPTLYGKVRYTPFEDQAAITIATNFFGTLEVTQRMLPLLRAAPSPRVVNIASSAGRLRGSQSKVEALTAADLSVGRLEALMRDFVRDAEAGEHVARGWPNTCYGVSKMGLIALTRVLAREEARMMVNAVDPGYCCTDQNDNHGPVPPSRGASTPVLLATLPQERRVSGKLFYEEREIPWAYGQ